MTEIAPGDVVADMEPIDMEDGELVEGAIIIVKTSRADGLATRVLGASPGLSHWEQIGLLTSALDSLRFET